MPVKELLYFYLI